MPKILIVEDDKTTRDMLERLFAFNGYTVITTPDGARALAAARSQRPDLIVMDMGLPILNGWQATYRLKSAPETRRIPVIAITACAFNEDREHCFAVGCDDYIIKPIDVPRLLIKVRTHLERAAAAEASASAAQAAPAADG